MIKIHKLVNVFFVLVPLLLILTSNIYDDIGKMIIGFSIIVFFSFLLISIDYMSPSFSIITPYLFIILLTLLPISKYHRDIDSSTINLILTIILIGMIYIILFNIPTNNPVMKKGKWIILFNNYLLFLIPFYLLTVLNIILAGYIPLLDGIIYGNAKHLAFGISGLYGFYLAYGNFLAIFSFYSFLLTHKKIYFNVFLSILIIMILFVTRLNVLSILIESYVIYNYVRGKVNALKVTLFFIIFILFFSLTGDYLRSVDIKELVAIKNEYLWIPNVLIWVYSYFFFNILNLDNIVTSEIYPLYDGSSFAQLIPNVIRPDFGHTVLLEKSHFTVAPYLLPLYRDVGFIGCMLFTILIIYISLFFFKRIQISNSFFYLGIYSILYFCALMSFFNNFWFYLPIIFQVVFVLIGYSFLLKKVNE